MTDGPIKLTSDSGGRLLEMALQSPVYHFYYTHLHFHISYLHFLPRYKSESLWLIRPFALGPEGRAGRITVLLLPPTPYIILRVPAAVAVAPGEWSDRRTNAAPITWGVGEERRGVLAYQT